MTAARFAKVMSANDTGATGGHQGGILVPKGDSELLAFFPPLDPAVLNPDAWIVCEDDDGQDWKLRYVYYNNSRHGSGTRNEYRLTYLTKYLRRSEAREGDSLVFTATEIPGRYRITVQRAAPVTPATTPAAPGPIRLTGWRRVH